MAGTHRTGIGAGAGDPAAAGAPSWPGALLGRAERARMVAQMILDEG